MQTFLPYPDFYDTAKCLDNRRLNKQLVEVQQILRTLIGKSDGWQNHPAVRMWRGYESTLRGYGLTVNREYAQRFGRPLAFHKSGQEVLQLILADTGPPPWLGLPAFHAAHRSNLLRKDPIWYGRFGWTEPNDLPYVWPTT